MPRRIKTKTDYDKRLKEVRAEYGDMAAGYDAGSQDCGWKGPTQVTAALKEYVRPGMHVLDAGTGTGEVMQRLRAVPLERPLHIVGLDLSEEMLKKCQDKHVANELHAQDLTRRWPVAKASQDIVTSSGVMEYLDDRQAQRFIRQAARALKPDGRIAITFRPVRKSESSTGQKLHAVERIKDLLKRNGIVPETVQEFDAYQGTAGIVRYILMTGVRQHNSDVRLKRTSAVHPRVAPRLAP